MGACAQILVNVRDARTRYDVPASATIASFGSPRREPLPGISSDPIAGCGAAWLARLTGGQEVPGSNPGSPTERNPSSQEVFGTHPSSERAGIPAVNASISCALTDWSLGQVQSQERGGLTAATFLGQRATSRQCKKTMERVMPGCMLRNALDPSSSATVSLARHQLAYPRTGVRQ